MIFSLTERSETIPSLFLSSGRYPIPAFIASIGFLILTGLPSTDTVPLVTRSAPNIARTHSLRPDPSSPVNPLTSPALILKSKGLMPSELESPFASNTISPFASSSSSLSLLLISAISSSSLPSILETSSTLGRSSMTYSPTSPPSRRTVILSHTS